MVFYRAKTLKGRVSMTGIVDARCYQDVEEATKHLVRPEEVYRKRLRRRPIGRLFCQISNGRLTAGCEFLPFFVLINRRNFHRPFIKYTIGMSRSVKQELKRRCDSRPQDRGLLSQKLFSIPLGLMEGRVPAPGVETSSLDSTRDA